ncbi:MAG: RAMP superfamily CRISPR-associated protein [Phreatobacter sp.]
MADLLPIRLWLLSPLHIGSGADLNWLSATIDLKSGTLLRFDPTRIPAGSRLANGMQAIGKQALELPPAANEHQVSNLIKRFQQQLKGSLSDLASAATGMSFVAPNIAEHLAQRIGLTGHAGATDQRNIIQSLNIAEIALDVRTGRPAIPGSTLKGALRTAWLDSLAQKPDHPGQGVEKGKEYEEKLLGGSFGEDPFSHVAVEDLRVPETMTSAIVAAVNVKRQPGARQGQSVLPIQVAAALPSLEPSCGSLRKVRRAPDETGSSTPNLKELLAACHSFHQGLWAAHQPQLKQLASSWWVKAMEETLRVIAPQRGLALVRLGKFGTAEAKTTRDRSIRVKVARDGHKSLPAGTTFWLAGDRDDRNGVPFGWAVLAWGDADPPQLPVLQAFGETKPWSGLMKPAQRPAPSGRSASAPSAGPMSLSEGQQALERLKMLLENRKLSGDYVKNELKRAAEWSQEDRTVLRDWVKANLVTIEPQRFKHKPILELLGKLG